MLKTGKTKNTEKWQTGEVEELYSIRFGKKEKREVSAAEKKCSPFRLV